MATKYVQRVAPLTAGDVVMAGVNYGRGSRVEILRPETAEQDLRAAHATAEISRLADGLPAKAGDVMYYPMCHYGYDRMGWAFAGYDR